MKIKTAVLALISVSFLSGPAFAVDMGVGTTPNRSAAAPPYYNAPGNAAGITTDTGVSGQNPTAAQRNTLTKQKAPPPAVTGTAAPLNTVRTAGTTALSNAVNTAASTAVSSIAGGSPFNISGSVASAMGGIASAAIGGLLASVPNRIPEFGTAPLTANNQMRSAAAKNANAVGGPKTFDGVRDLANGSCSEEVYKQLVADSQARADLQNQATQDIVMQVSNLPSVDALACTSRTGANIIQSVETLFQSSGFAQRFFDVSIIRNFQISVGSSPVAQALIAPVNAVLQQTMASVLSGITGGLLGGGASSAAQAAASNCEQQRRAYELTRACNARLRDSGFAGTTAQDCLDINGIQAQAVAGGVTEGPGGFAGQI